MTSMLNILNPLLRPTTGIPLLLLSLYAIYSFLASKPNLPDLPWVGLRKERFAKIRCRWRTTFNYHESVQRAYQEVNQRRALSVIPVLTLPAVFPQGS